MEPQPYHVATDEDYDRLGITNEYDGSVLVGPDDWYAILDQPEDRTWFRDGACVVDRLNELHATLDATRAEVEKFRRVASAAHELSKVALEMRDAARAEGERLRVLLGEARDHLTAVTNRGHETRARIDAELGGE